MNADMTGRKAIVTGASRGIGRAIALAFAGAGADVAVVATSEANATATAAACREHGVRAFPYGLDVSDTDAVTEWGGRVLEDLGGVDALVNNAGITRDGLFMRMKEDDWDRVIDVNLKGAFNVTRALARTILKNRNARIVNVSSVVGIAGNAGQVNYAASKGGLIALTRSLAKEFGGRGVLVNAVAPGLIETDMTRDLSEPDRQAMLGSVSLGRLGTPEDVAGVVVFLCGPDNTYVTGQVLRIDGGMRI